MRPVVQAAIVAALCAGCGSDSIGVDYNAPVQLWLSIAPNGGFVNETVPPETPVTVTMKTNAPDGAMVHLLVDSVAACSKAVATNHAVCVVSLADPVGAHRLDATLTSEHTEVHEAGSLTIRPDSALFVGKLLQPAEGSTYHVADAIPCRWSLTNLRAYEAIEGANVDGEPTTCTNNKLVVPQSFSTSGSAAAQWIGEHTLVYVASASGRSVVAVDTVHFTVTPPPNQIYFTALRADSKITPAFPAQL